MQELFDNAIAFLRAVLRFRWTVLFVAWIIALAGWAYVWTLDDRYSASARLSVDSNSILAPLLRGITVQPDVNERVSLMSRTLLNRPNLEKLARMSDLDVTVTTPYEKEQLLDELGRTVRLSGSRGNSSLYTVSYVHTDPAVARRVVQSLITVFVESSLGDKREDSTSAQAFLDRQISDYEQRLAAAERRLSDFKRENAGKMPGEAGGYYQRLDVATNLERATRLELREAEKRRDSLRRQLSEERPTLALGEAGSGALSPIDAQLAAQNEELATLLLSYTERHPRIAQLRESIAALEARKARGEGDAPSSAGGSRVPSPVYQELRALLAEAEARVSELEVRAEEYDRQVVELEDTVESIPSVERELQQLDRDYAIIREQYDALLERRESARLSEQVEQNVDDVKFRVIDPPFVPSRPSGPNKVLLSAAVLAAALGAGAALAFLLALLRPVFYDADVVAARTGRSVVGTVSYRHRPGTKFRRRLGWLLYGALAGSLLLAAASVVALHKGMFGLEQLEPLLRSRFGPILEAGLTALFDAVEAGKRAFARVTGAGGGE